MTKLTNLQKEKFLAGAAKITGTSFFERVLSMQMYTHTIRSVFSFINQIIFYSNPKNSLHRPNQLQVSPNYIKGKSAAGLSSINFGGGMY